MALKTLKDLQKEYEWKLDTYQALRQEAIKQVKHVLGSPVDTPKNKENAVRLMIIFFNITEEDLK